MTMIYPSFLPIHNAYTDWNETDDGSIPPRRVYMRNII